MDSSKNLPPRKPASAKETNQMLQELGFTNPLRTVNKNVRDDGELISRKTPSDVNIGQPKSIRESITAAMATMQPPIPLGKYQLKQEVKRSASSELLKIEDLNIYQSACATYKLGLERGWSKEKLLESVEEWRMFEANSGRR